MIEMADKWKGYIPKFSCISPAHSNTSVLEAWFSLVRKENLDDAVNYPAVVANKKMAKTIKALHNNKCYTSDEVGELSIGKIIGPRQLINFYEQRKKKVAALISKYKTSRTHNLEATRVFSDSVVEAIPKKKKDHEKNVLHLLAKKKLDSGFLLELLVDCEFKHWLRLSRGNTTESWFNNLLEDMIELSISSAFDQACRMMMDMMFEFAVKAMNGRRNDELSYECDLHEYHRSNEFDLLCLNYLPGNLSQKHSCCAMLFISLSEIFSSMLKDALLEERERRNPELFVVANAQSLSAAEKNNEVNSFLGWAIQSTLKKRQYTKEDEKTCVPKSILRSIRMLERDIDEDYLESCYDMNMAMVNLGGLTLVSKSFFNWGRDLMELIRSSLTEKTIDLDPKNCFDKAETDIMANKKLKAEFIQLCDQVCEAAGVAHIEEVYKILVPKTCHARFSVVLKRWKENNVKRHGQLALRVQLKAMTGLSNSNKKPRISPPTAGGDYDEDDEMANLDLDAVIGASMNAS